MTDIQILAGTLTASLTDRTVSGLLLPFGEVGRSNLGKVKVKPGAISIPEDVASIVGLNVEHNREEPVGRATTVTQQDAGLFATYSIAKGPEGDAVLADIESGKRKNLSAEVKNIVIKGGEIISGALFGSAVCVAGAFPSATLLAADVGETPADLPPVVLEPVDGVLVVAATSIPETVTVTAADITTTFAPKESEPPVTLPNTLDAGAITQPRPLSLADVGRILFAARQGHLDEVGAQALTEHNGATLFGALSDVKFDGTGGLAPIMTQPQWIGEVWSATVYRQQVLPLFDHADLTATTWNGFRWVTKPTAGGADWPGNKADIASNTLVVEPVTGTAKRYALGHDIAREFVDFPAPGFFESYAKAVGEDYAAWADSKVATAALAGATALAADALTTLPGVAGGTIGSAASAIIDGATKIIDTGTLPTFALVAPALWKQMVKTPKSNVIGYLNLALGLQDGELDTFVIRPSATVTAGKVLVGAKSAATVYELPGAAPIRIDALDLARGGIDKAAFGYCGVNINDKRALQLVTAATA